MSFAVLRRMRTAGKGTAAVAGDQRQGLRPAGDPPGPAQIQHLPGRGEHRRDDLGTVGQLQQLRGRNAGAVGGAAVPDPVDQVVGVDGDDHRRRNPPGVRNVPGPQLPVAQILQGIVAALPIGPAVDFSGRIDPGFRQRIQQGLEFRAGGPGEPEVPDIRPVAGRPQMKVAPVMLTSSLGIVPSGSMASTTRAVRSRRSSGGNRFACSVSSFSPLAMAAGSNPRRSTLSKALTMIATFSALTSPALLRRGQHRPDRLQRLTQHRRPGPDRFGRPDPTGRFDLRHAQPRRQHPAHVALTQHGGQIQPFRDGNHLVVNHRQPIPELFEVLHELDRPMVVEGFQAAGVEVLHQLLITGDQSWRGLAAGVGSAAPLESHASFYSNTYSNTRSFPLQIRESEGRGPSRSRRHHPQRHCSQRLVVTPRGSGA